MKKLILVIVSIIILSLFIFGACIGKNNGIEPSTPNLGSPIDFELIKTYSDVGLNDKIRSRVAMATDVDSLQSIIKNESTAQEIFDYFDEEYFKDNNVIFHFWVNSPGTVSISATAIYISSDKITIETLTKKLSGEHPDVVYDYGLKALRVSKDDIGDIRTIEELQKYEIID